jgi:hypothetical protein
MLPFIPEIHSAYLPTQISMIRMPSIQIYSHNSGMRMMPVTKFNSLVLSSNLKSTKRMPAFSQPAHRLAVLDSVSANHIPIVLIISHESDKSTLKIVFSAELELKKFLPGVRLNKIPVRGGINGCDRP